MTKIAFLLAIVALLFFGVFFATLFTSTQESVYTLPDGSSFTMKGLRTPPLVFHDGTRIEPQRIDSTNIELQFTGLFGGLMFAFMSGAIRFYTKTPHRIISVNEHTGVYKQ